MRPDFDLLADQFDDDETFLNYIWEDGLVKGVFIGYAIAVVMMLVLP
jgi:hypothetical protein